MSRRARLLAGAAVALVAVGVWAAVTRRATRDGAHLLRLLAMKIETIEPGFGLDSMRLVAGRVEPLSAEQPSLRGAQRRSNPLSLSTGPKLDCFAPLAMTGM